GKSASRIRNFGIRIGSKGWVGRAGARSGAGRTPRLNEAPRAAPGRATRSAFTRARRLVQPRCAPSPASRPSPTDPALRANPYPEVTDPACRLPLPTLFQHARGCLILETCCGYGYGPARDLHPLPRIFMGQRELTGHRRNRDAFQGAGPSLGANPFQGARPFSKKRELSPGLPPASPGSVASPHWAPRGARLRHSGFGDLNPTPFRSAEGNGGHRPPLRNGARLSLRTD
uniref:Uncharacterized protein n=1 Tax=Taeniopygia guttata TaxID=59729 RepID=A0A674GP78_TAEGU